MTHTQDNEDVRTSTTVVHRMFTIGILAKGLNGGVELLAGGFLFLVPPTTISQVILFLTQHELIEDPQDLLANYVATLAQHFRPRRHRLSAPEYRQEMRKRFQLWREITLPALAA